MSNDKVQSIMALVHGYALAFANVCNADDATVRQRIEDKDALAAALESAIREALAAPAHIELHDPVTIKAGPAEPDHHPV